MKKVIKIAAGVAMVCFLTGVVLTGIGLASGGKAFFSIALAEQRVYVGSEIMVENAQTTDPFTSIDVKGDIEDIEVILTEDRYGVEYRVVRKDPKIKVEKETLTIRESSGNGGIFWFWGRTGKAYIKIYVPESAPLENIKIITDTGNIRLDELTAAEVKLDSDTGNVQVSEVTVENLVVSTDTGNVTAEAFKAGGVNLKSDTGNLHVQEGTMDTVTFETDTGDIRAEDLTVTVLTAESDTGNVKIGILGRAQDYEMNLKSDTGKIKVDGNSTGEKYKSQGKGRKNLQAKTDTGNISIGFSEK